MSNSKKPVSILFVCLGNICRSPMAESVFNHLVEGQVPGLAKAQSAGTANYHAGEWPDHRTIAVLKEMGIHQYSRARQVQVNDFYNFDYILAMDRQNLDDLEKIRPSASTGIVRLFGEFRSKETITLDIPDPYYGQIFDFQSVYKMVLEFSEGLLRHVAHNRE